MYTKERKTWLKHLDFFAVDVVSLIISFLVAFSVRTVTITNSDANYTGIVIVSALFVIISSAMLSNTDNILRRGMLQ